MSVYSFSNAVIGLAREYKKYAKQKWTQYIAETLNEDIVYALTEDGYFREEDVEKFANALTNMIEHSTPTRKLTDEQKQAQKQNRKEAKERAAKEKAEREAKEKAEFERLKKKYESGTSGWDSNYQD